MWPPYSWVWVLGYGLPGRPSPTVSDHHLIGGARNAVEYVVDSWQTTLIVPKPAEPYYMFSIEENLRPTPYEVEIYKRKEFRPSWAAAPVSFWVEEHLSDEEARALLMEHIYV